MLRPCPATCDCGDGSTVAGAGRGLASDLGHLVSVRAGWRSATGVVV